MCEGFGFGLKAGWGDYYEWDRPDNFLDFGLNGDGRYVEIVTDDDRRKGQSEFVLPADVLARIDEILDPVIESDPAKTLESSPKAREA